ncbi:MAG: PA14 domain-containing protein, partial [Patescibacteria group bacterium]|nr:PA14 domain-containing protein [Patescibacteria group bacterium]
MSVVRWLRAVSIPAISLFAAWFIPAASAQSFRHGEVTFNAVRPVSVEEGKGHTVVVTEFFHHGEINPAGSNVLVTAGNNQAVASRVLQLGPGDYCRLAFQTLERQTRYEVLYGGEHSPSDTPPWTNRDGLLLETRQYKHCNPNNLDAVREAFASAKPIGSGYVDGVHHSSNPFTLKAEPFLSHYSGFLNIDAAGTYGFLTSSRDASFLLIDDKLVVAAPGLHGPMHQARPGSRKDVRLESGSHKFDYYHLAAGPDATMTAAWEVNPPEEKPKPAAIPPSVFRAERIGTAPAGAVTLRTVKSVPDFLAAVVGDVPLPDNPEPL